jgi:hypothetical protein
MSVTDVAVVENTKNILSLVNKSLETLLKSENALAACVSEVLAQGSPGNPSREQLLKQQDDLIRLLTALLEGPCKVGRGGLSQAVGKQHADLLDDAKKLLSVLKKGG